MPDGLLESLAANPPPSLGDVVRLALGDPTFALSSWTVERLSDHGIRNPDGLLLFSGAGGDERTGRPWSVVLKIIDSEDADQLPQDHLWYWKREVLAFESGLLDNLPAGVSAPRCYCIETRDDAAWIWMEHVADAGPRSWGTDEFVGAAYAAGRFGGAYLCGRPLPHESWLARDHARGWVEGGSPEPAWLSPLVQRCFPVPLRERVMRLWDDRERVFDWLQRVPQTFAHGDFHRRNLIIRGRAGVANEIVAVDWAWCGTAPVGGDLGMLLGMSATLGDIEPDTIAELERPVCDAYLAGLREAGWNGDSGLARLGYTAWLAMYAGVTAPGLTAFWTADDMLPVCERQFGPPEDAARRWATVCAFALDRSEEARGLAERLLR
jgi:hypothetical protein